MCCPYDSSVVSQSGTPNGGNVQVLSRKGIPPQIFLQRSCQPLALGGDTPGQQHHLGAEDVDQVGDPFPQTADVVFHHFPRLRVALIHGVKGQLAGHFLLGTMAKLEKQSFPMGLSGFPCLPNESGGAAVGEVLGIGKSTAFRLLATLEMRNFVVKDDNNKYRLGMKFTYFGTMVLSRMEIIRRARPFLEKLSLLTNADTHLAIWDENYSVRFIDKVSGNAPVGVDSYVGMLRRSYATASGKVLLASLPKPEAEAYLTSEKLIPQTPVTTTDPQKLMKLLEEIRKSGVCVSKDEDELGFTCIASPITGKDGKAIASVSISGTNAAMSVEGSHYKEMVTDTAKKISAAL